jgi:N-carbamoylputrescine amidase
MSEADKSATTVRVAAVQMESRNGAIRSNLDRATTFVEQAASRGAELILLPEFMPTGYVFTKAIWDAGEPANGSTVQWLLEQSAHFGVYLGTSFLEAEGDDFFNTFVLTTPLGKEAGRVRKQTPALWETYFTRGATGSHVIDTAIGRIGVGICYENVLSYTPSLMHSQGIDLLLMPHSMPSPTESAFVSRRWIDAYEEILAGHAQRYADLLGVPTVVVNKSGRWQSPLPGIPFAPQDSHFAGLSTIADSDGQIKAKLGAEEDLIIAGVTLDPTRKNPAPPACHGRWAIDLPWFADGVRVVEAAGAAWYRLSRERKRRAREISAR